MKVYITYDRYEHDEWFQVYHYSTSKSEIMKTLKSDLIDFISYGPDDCHSFQCQVVDIPKSKFDRLTYLLSLNLDTTEYSDDDKELKDILIDIFDEWSPDNCILFTDGCTDNDELVKYILKNDEDFENSDEEEVYEKLIDDQDYYDLWLNKYVSNEYNL